MFYFIFGFCVKKNFVGQSLRKARRIMRRLLPGHYQELGGLENLYDFTVGRRRGSAVVVGISGGDSDQGFSWGWRIEMNGSTKNYWRSGAEISV